MWRLIIIFLALLIGFFSARTPSEVEPSKTFSHLAPEKEFPVSEHKSFVIVVYAYNQEKWCEKALQSIFEQDYDHYRVIVIDDGSIDGTYKKAKDFILKNSQDEKVILIHNEVHQGMIGCLYRAIDSCLDREIVLPLEAKNWLCSRGVLKKLNGAYQNPDVWITSAHMFDYPLYEMKGHEQIGFYAVLFKQIHLKDLLEKGRFIQSPAAYIKPLIELSGGRIRNVQEPIAFYNLSPPEPVEKPSSIDASYQPLSSFPMVKNQKRCDLLVFSFDRPLQLYACLESLQRYMGGFENINVLYRVSNAAFQQGYEIVKTSFPQVHFVMQSVDYPKKEFKSKVNQMVFQSPSEYILFAVDDIVVKDFVDLQFCMDQMEKTKAYGFYLRFGKHISYCYQFGQPQSLPPSQSLPGGVYAYNFAEGEYDWAFPNSLDMTIFRKEDLKKPFHEINFQTPNSLEYNWASKFAPKEGIGLYFEMSKLVNLPLNIVGKTGNPHMNFLNPEELLAKFQQGLKIDIDPLYKMENKSPHLDYIPEFVPR